jgi:hypothetical protein
MTQMDLIKKSIQNGIDLANFDQQLLSDEYIKEHCYCLICSDIIGFPIILTSKINKKCQCTSLRIYCLQCIRSMFGMNNREDMDQIRHLRCLTCSQEYDIDKTMICSLMLKASDIYVKCYYLAKKMDELFGPILQCPRECDVIDILRINLDKHINVCNKVKKTCYHCKNHDILNMIEHLQSYCSKRQITCKACNKDMFFLYLKSHYAICQMFLCSECNIPVSKTNENQSFKQVCCKLNFKIYLLEKELQKLKQ